MRCVTNLLQIDHFACFGVGRLLQAVAVCRFHGALPCRGHLRGVEHRSELRRYERHARVFGVAAKQEKAESKPQAGLPEAFPYWQSHVVQRQSRHRGSSRHARRRQLGQSTTATLPNAFRRRYGRGDSPRSLPKPRMPGVLDRAPQQAPARHHRPRLRGNPDTKRTLIPDFCQQVT